MTDTLTAIGVILAGIGRYLEEKSNEPHETHPLMRLALDGVQLDGPIRECVRKFTGPSGKVRCAEWKWAEGFCPSGTSTEAAQSEPVDGGFYGHEIEYRHPSTTEGAKGEYRARYKVLEADRLLTSHRENAGFVADPRYPPGVQDRDYSNPDGQDQIAVIRNAKALRPALVLGCSVTSSEGTPIVWGADNVVLSGNSRAMAVRYASAHHHKRYGEYRDELMRLANFYGFVRSDIESMDTPILVREVLDLPQSKIGEFASLANKPISRELDNVGKAIELSKLIPESAVEQLNINENETLRQFLNTSRGARFVKNLLPNIVATERARLFKDDGSLSQSGILIVEDALFAKLFDERRDVIEAMSDANRRSLELSMPLLLSLRSSIASGAIQASWDLPRAIGEAVIFTDRNLRDTTVGDYLRQTSFIAREPLNLDTLMGQSLLLLDKYGSKPRVLRDKIGAFVREAQYTMGFWSKADPVEVLKGLVGEFQLSYGVNDGRFSTQKLGAWYSAPKRPQGRRQLR